MKTCSRADREARCATSLKETRAASRQHNRRSAATPHSEPIAIVGMACRFPGGVGSPEDLWQLVADGPRRDRRRSRPTAAGTSSASTTPTPTARARPTPARAASSTTPPSSTPSFFGICPREALAMDPQQRLLLETVLGGVRARRHRPDVAARQPRPACSPA